MHYVFITRRSEDRQRNVGKFFVDHVMDLNYYLYVF